MAEIITKQCPVCEESFETKYPDKIYCSTRCKQFEKQSKTDYKERHRMAQKMYREAHPEREREYNKMRYPKPHCPKCGKEMNKKRWKNKLCDDCDTRSVYEKHIRNNHLEKKYGITQRDYDRMLENQNGVCKVCRRKPGKRRLCVDHDHDTGEVRGLLCSSCNQALGYAKDDVSVLQKLIEYLIPPLGI